MKISIFIIVYETARYLPKQLELIKRFCTDSEYTIYVVNNSAANSKTNDAIEYQANSTGAIYIKTIPTDSNPSVSHALACNLVYKEIGIGSDYCLFLDHDIFPFKAFAVKEKTENYLMVGVEQMRFTETKKIRYIYPGLLYINTSILTKQERSLVDFLPTNKYGIMLDTGGSLHYLISKHDESKFIFLSEKRISNNSFNKNRYKYYAEIDGWMHFINGSNWAGLEGEDERINSLFIILEQKLEQSKIEIPKVEQPKTEQEIKPLEKKGITFCIFGRKITIEKCE